MVGFEFAVSNIIFFFFFFDQILFLAKKPKSSQNKALKGFKQGKHHGKSTIRSNQHYDLIEV
jgi:hypothetical protein